MSWHLLEKSLDEVSKQSTVFGKLWITFLFVFRVIAVTRMGETIYADEQAAFRCNIKQIGCENVCFNEFSPISHVRFWGFQIIIVATPALMFLVYTTHAVSCIPSAKLIRRKMEFLRSKKQRKSRVSKNTSKTTQSTGKNTISTTLHSRKYPNSTASAWMKQKQELVSKWKTTPNPALDSDYANVKDTKPCWRQHNDETLSPPAYQENNANLYFEEVWMKNSHETGKYGKQEYDKKCEFKKQFKSNGESQFNSQEPNCLFKEVSLYKVRRHSEGDLNSLQTLSKAAKLFSVPNSSYVSHATRSPPHYSVIHLGQLTDVTASNFFVSPSCEQRQLEVYSTDPGVKSTSTLGKRGKHSNSVFLSTDFLASRHRMESAKSKETKLGSNRSNTTGRSRINSDKKDNARRTTSFDPSDSGYVEFAKRVAGIERRIAIVYFFQCITRLTLESAFLYAQYRLFQFDVPELFKCQRWPCPNTVDCYVSRPEEKSVMLHFMFYLTAGCILLALCEALTLVFRYIKERIEHNKLKELFDESDVIEKGEGGAEQIVQKNKGRSYNIAKHPYLLDGYNKMLRMHSIEEYDESTSDDTKSTKSSNSETETDDAQANSFNSQDVESMFENDLGAEAGDLNNEDNEAAEIFV